MTEEIMPDTKTLVNSLIVALREMGGQGTNEQIRKAVIEKLNLPDEVVAAIHTGRRSQLEYKLAWARTIAKQKGLIVPLGRMNWALKKSP
jgi:restriction system protein